MKKAFKTICAVMAAIMLLQVEPLYATESRITNPTIDTLIAQQERAVAANDKINDGMGFTRDGLIDYEDDFAGAKIIEDKLVLCITDMSDRAKKKYLAWAGEYADAVRFEKAEYSYNFLSQKADEIVDSMGETVESMIGYYVSEAKNAIVIRVSKDSEKSLSRLQKKVKADVPIEYEVCDTPILISTQVKGGSKLTNASTGKNVSVGCCGYYNGTPSIATCGHGSTGVGNQFWVGNGADGSVGSISYYHFGNNYNGDYAIISGTNSNYIHTNKIGSAYSIKGTVSSPAVNTYVYFYGAATQQYGYGQVQDRGVTSNFVLDGSTYSIGGLSVVRVANGSVASGDSGGSVFTVTSGTTNAKFAGVMTAKSTSAGYLDMYFTPASYFTSLGFSVKTN